VSTRRSTLDRFTLNPRGLQHADAAAYVGLCKTAFDMEVRENRLPPPIYSERKPKVWDRVALDEALDRKRKNTQSLAERARGLREDTSR
jgi:hypothetical protein